MFFIIALCSIFTCLYIWSGIFIYRQIKNAPIMEEMEEETNKTKQDDWV